LYDSFCRLRIPNFRVLWNALLGEHGVSDHCELDPNNADEQLSPVEKLEKFIDCEHSYSR